jgi:hypothetical protein
MSNAGKKITVESFRRYLIGLDACPSEAYIVIMCWHRHEQF